MTAALPRLSGLIIDSFAGGGGASTGIEWALGRSPDYAINHDAAAIAMHRANHPSTIHLTENIWKVDPHAVIAGRPVFLLWASPDCRHHSKAKGGKPVSRSVRGLADVVLVWAKVARPQIILLENVEEFADWGPLGEDGRPCPARKGMEFRRWVRALEAEGYAVEWAESRAYRKGAPTIRKRLYLCARRDGKPIIIPPATHERPDHPDVEAGKLLPWRTAAEIIDWSIPCPSIFLTRAEAKSAGIKVVRPLADKTMARIARGMKRYVLDRAQPFIVTCNHSGTGFRGQGLDRPFATVTKARDAFGLVSPLVSYAQQGGASRAPDVPLHTICANAKDQNQVVAAHLMTMRNSGKPFTAIDEPTHTITAGGAGLSAVAAFLAQHNGNGVIGRDASEPVSTLTTSAANQQPVMAYLAPCQSQSPGADAEAPLGAVLAGGGHHSVVSVPFMSPYYATDQAPELDAPLPTATTRDRFALADVAAVVPPFDEEKAAGARRVADFLRAEGVWSANADGSIEFVQVGPYIIYDIGMRMLTPRELALAQGFPPDYILAAPFDGGVLTETEQRHKIGNSVSPNEAASWVWWNCVHALTLPDVKRRRARLPEFVPAPPRAPAELFVGAAA